MMKRLFSANAAEADSENLIERISRRLTSVAVPEAFGAVDVLSRNRLWPDSIANAFQRPVPAVRDAPDFTESVQCLIKIPVAVMERGRSEG